MKTRSPAMLSWTSRLKRSARWLAPLLMLAAAELQFEPACDAAPGCCCGARSVRPRGLLARRRYARAHRSRVPTEERFYEHVLQQLAAKRPDEALAEMNRALAIYPGSTELRLLRAMALSSKSRDAEALAEMNMVVEQHPANAGLKLMQGVLSFMSALHQPSSEKQLQAIDELAKLERGVEQTEREAEVFDAGMLFLRAVVLSNDKKFAEAIDQYTRFIDQCPQDKKHEKELRAGYVARAWAYREAGQYARALDDYTAVIRLAPDDYAAYSYKAWLLATCKDDHIRDGRKAVELATRARELSHGDKWVEGTLAAAHAELGDFKQAVEHQRKALEAIDAPPAPKKADKKPNSFSIMLWKSSPSKEPDHRAEAVARLEGYKQGKPLRE